MIDDAESETRALIERLRADAQSTRSQAEYYERDAQQLMQRAARKRQQADVWEGAASRLEALLVADELQQPMMAKEEEKNDVFADADS